MHNLLEETHKKQYKYKCSLSEKIKIYFLTWKYIYNKTVQPNFLLKRCLCCSLQTVESNSVFWRRYRLEENAY